MAFKGVFHRGRRSGCRQGNPDEIWARQGTCTRSPGGPMLSFPLAVAESLNPERLVVVVGRDADRVREAFAERATFVSQEEQRGTGHAVAQNRAGPQGDSTATCSSCMATRR